MAVCHYPRKRAQIHSKQCTGYMSSGLLPRDGYQFGGLIHIKLYTTQWSLYTGTGAYYNELKAKCCWKDRFVHNHIVMFCSHFPACTTGQYRPQSSAQRQQYHHRTTTVNLSPTPELSRSKLLCQTGSPAKASA